MNRNRYKYCYEINKRIVKYNKNEEKEKIQMTIFPSLHSISISFHYSKTSTNIQILCNLTECIYIFFLVKTVLCSERLTYLEEKRYSIISSSIPSYTANTLEFSRALFKSVK